MIQCRHTWPSECECIVRMRKECFWLNLSDALSQNYPLNISFSFNFDLISVAILLIYFGSVYGFTL